MRISDILHENNKLKKKNLSRPQVGLHSDENLTPLVKDCTKDGRLKHFHYLNWGRAPARSSND